MLTRCPCFLPSSSSTRRGTVSARLTGRSPRREDAIENALKAKLQARAAQRRAQEMMARQAAKELEEFTNEFKNAARHCFELIDVDKGGSLSKEEMSARCVRPSTRARRGDGAAALAVRRVWGGSYAIDATPYSPRFPRSVTAVKSNQKVIKFLINCGNKNLQYLLVPSCVEINQCVGYTRQFFTKSFLGNDVAVLARSSGEEPASPRHRAGVASMAWRSTRRFRTNAP